METYVNPILNGDYPDPTLVRVGGDYYMTYSCAELTPGLKILHSRDLVHWRTLCSAVLNAGCIAAPELICHEGLFYLYYPANGTNYVVTARDPAGPWSDPVDLKIGAIDPGHVVGPDGTRYLYVSGGSAFELSADGLRVVRSLGRLYEGWNYDPTLHTEGKWLESPKFFQRGGMYYLVSAQGGTSGPSTAHMCVVARARHPLGPWENAPNNPIVHTWNRSERWWCKGHGTIFETAAGQWYIVYHAYERGFLNHGRKTLLQKVDWTEDGWPYVPGDAAEEAPAPLPLQAAEDAMEDSFADGRVKPYWAFWERSDPARVGASERGGIRMEGQGAAIADSCPMTLPCGLKTYAATVDVELEGEATGGLTLFYAPQAHCGIGLAPGCVQLYKYGKPYVRIPELWRRATLRIVNDEHDVSYQYRVPGGEWIDIDFGCEVSGLNHNALGGYASLRPGIFVCGQGAAHFSNFSVKPLDA